MRHVIGVISVAAYRFGIRARAKAFSLALSGSFAEFGSRTVIQPPLRLSGERRIALGSCVFIGSDSWLQVLGRDSIGPAIRIGDGTSIAGHFVISARKSVVVGRRVLVARGVYISDHSHVHGQGPPVLDQGVSEPVDVEVGDGAWLGENVVIGPGVRIGRGAVVGANSVVLEDIPDHAVAVGAPARVVHEPMVLSRGMPAG